MLEERIGKHCFRRRVQTTNVFPRKVKRAKSAYDYEARFSFFRPFRRRLSTRSAKKINEIPLTNRCSIRKILNAIGGDIASPKKGPCFENPCHGISSIPSSFIRRNEILPRSLDWDAFLLRVTTDNTSKQEICVYDRTRLSFVIDYGI